MRQSTLVGRDPALAAIMGAAAMGGMGPEADFGADFAFAMDDFDFSDDYGDGLEGDDDDLFGDEAFDFGAAGGKKGPSRGQVMKAFAKYQASMKKTARRANLIAPNRGSKVDVERYSFTLAQAITLGTAVALNFGAQPDTKIRPQRCTMNSPAPMFAFITDIKVANVSVIVGSGVEDSYNYNANGMGQTLDMPTLSPANRATVTGNYTGFVPPGYVGGTATNFTASFKGPATIVA